MKITDDILSDLRARYPRGVKVFTLSDGRDFAFQTPSPDHYRRYNGEMLKVVAGNAAEAVSAGERIAEELCVWPSREDFSALRNIAPKAAGRIGEKLVEIAGGELTLIEGKADASR